MNLSDYEYINSNEQESFARFTIEKRLPAVLQSIIDEKVYQEKIQRALEGLLHELPALTVRPIKLDQVEQELWIDFFNRYEGLSILEVPFFYSEIYFYRYLLEVVNFSHNSIDPFLSKKKEELNEDTFANLLAQTRSVEEGIYISLYGNKADLSQIKRAEDDIKLILDQSHDLIKCIEACDTIHILLDNAGTELFSDLILVHRILKFSRGKTVVLYPKSLPLLVSDATMADIELLLDFLLKSKNPKLKNFANAISNHIASGAIQFLLHPFWNSPSHFTNLSTQIQEKITPNDVLISKGDANYRRFFEDRNIPPSFTGAASICGSQFALRTLKSEIVSGLDEMKVKKLNQSDPDWMTSGKFAVIQKII